MAASVHCGTNIIQDVNLQLWGQRFGRVDIVAVESGISICWMENWNEIAALICESGFLGIKRDSETAH